MLRRPSVGARADVDDVRVRVGHVDGADRAGAEVTVRHVDPGRAVVGRLPDAAAGRPHIKGARLLGDAANRGNPAAAGRTDHSILQPGEQTGIVDDVGVGRLALRLSVGFDSSSDHQRRCAQKERGVTHLDHGSLRLPLTVRSRFGASRLRPNDSDVLVGQVPYLDPERLRQLAQLLDDPAAGLAIGQARPTALRSR